MCDTRDIARIDFAFVCSQYTSYIDLAIVYAAGDYRRDDIYRNICPLRNIMPVGVPFVKRFLKQHTVSRRIGT